MKKYSARKVEKNRSVTIAAILLDYRRLVGH